MSGAAAAPGRPPGVEFHTFTVVGRCPRTGRLGVGTATRSLAVGARVPHVRAGLGGRDHGAPTPTPEYRQLAVVDGDGFAAARTGGKNREWAGHRVRDGRIVLGSYLTGEHVLETMERAFTAHPDEDLEERLMRAIEAGRDAGGQHGGQQSAALLVHEDRSFAHVDLRVDVHPEPVGELRRVFDACRPAIPYYNLRQVDARVPPLADWLRDRPR